KLLQTLANSNLTEFFLSGNPRQRAQIKRQRKSSWHLSMPGAFPCFIERAVKPKGSQKTTPREEASLRGLFFVSF
ncbi:hypothetical protein D7Y09_12510, partial [bacterium 1XD42-1]